MRNEEFNRIDPKPKEHYYQKIGNFIPPNYDSNSLPKCTIHAEYLTKEEIKNRYWDVFTEEDLNKINDLL